MTVLGVRRLGVALAIFATLAGFGALWLSAARAQGVVDRFDHYRTGFPLDGRHASIPCEACHTSPTYQGAPRVCGQCHNNVLAEGKNFLHIPTSVQCESCHLTTDWRTSRFDHTNVTAGCVRCHNNFLAPGKNAAHPPTNEVCEVCHNTIHWNQILPTMPPSRSAVPTAR
jgi:hypothetical protein